MDANIHLGKGSGKATSSVECDIVLGDIARYMEVERCLVFLYIQQQENTQSEAG